MMNQKVLEEIDRLFYAVLMDRIPKSELREECEDDFDKLMEKLERLTEVRL